MQAYFRLRSTYLSTPEKVLTFRARGLETFSQYSFPRIFLLPPSSLLPDLLRVPLWKSTVNRTERAHNFGARAVNSNSC